MCNANEPAYPLVQPDPHGGYPYVSTGITKREAFALAAMQAFIGTAAAPCLSGLEGYEPQTAKAAYRMADAMLAAGDPQ